MAVLMGGEAAVMCRRRLESGRAPDFTAITDSGRDAQARRRSAARRSCCSSIRRTTRPAARSKRVPFATPSRGSRDSTRSCSASARTRPKSHQKFKEKFDLPYTLVADVDHAIAEKYGVWGEKSMYGRKYMGSRAHDVRHRSRRQDREGVREGEAGRAWRRGRQVPGGGEGANLRPTAPALLGRCAPTEARDAA